VFVGDCHRRFVAAEIGRIEVRKPRLHTLAWRNIGAVRQEQFSDFLAKQGKDSLFDDALIEAVKKRRSSNYALSLKLISVQIPVFIFLALSLIPIQASFSILGISPAANRNLREVFLVVSTLMAMIASGLSYYSAILTEMLAGYLDRRSKGDTRVRGYLNIAHGVEFFILPSRYGETVNTSGWYVAFIGTVAVALFLFFLIVVVTVFGIHVLVLRDVYNDPSFSPTVSVAVIAFVLIGDFLSIAISLVANGPILLNDFSNMFAAKKIGERDPAKESAIYQRLAQLHVQKPWLIRKFTRVKMPKKLPEV
jgi:hypothetical protein